MGSKDMSRKRSKFSLKSLQNLEHHQSLISPSLAHSQVSFLKSNTKFNQPFIIKSYLKCHKFLFITLWDILLTVRQMLAVTHPPPLVKVIFHKTKP